MKVPIPQICACMVLCYFAYHGISGKQGLAQWASLQKQERALRDELKTLKVERVRLSKDISRLKSDQLDLDYVEELSRSKLAFARDGEWIVYTSELE